MNAVAWPAWDVLSGLAIPQFVARETAVLVILAASLLVFRTLRERCLLLWIVGWLAYLGSHHALASPFPSWVSITKRARFSGDPP